MSRRRPANVIPSAALVSRGTNRGVLRQARGFITESARSEGVPSPALRKMEQEFERIRYDAQEARVHSLFEARKARRGLTEPEARRILWMYTSRDGPWSTPGRDDVGPIRSIDGS